MSNAVSNSEKNLTKKRSVIIVYNQVFQEVIFRRSSFLHKQQDSQTMDKHEAIITEV